MLQIASRREHIYDYFHQSAKCQEFFFATAQEERYAAYFTSMYLLQDTTESLIMHRVRGFSSNPLEGYIEFWGVMQAIFIQQDSISELYEAIESASLDTSTLPAWQSLRALRNSCAGHPAKKNQPKKYPLSRTFMGRNFGTYSAITFEQWQSGGSAHPTVDFGALIDNYVTEAEAKLDAILNFMKQQWP